MGVLRRGAAVAVALIPGVIAFAALVLWFLILATISVEANRDKLEITPLPDGPPDVWTMWAPAEESTIAEQSPFARVAPLGCGRGLISSFAQNNDNELIRKIWLPCRSPIEADLVLGDLLRGMGGEADAPAALDGGSDAAFAILNEEVWHVGGRG